MEQDVAESCEATPTNSTYGTPARVASPTASHDSDDDVINSASIENSLYTTCNKVAVTLQEKQIERLESQNAEYREKLLRTIRERDLNEELLNGKMSENFAKLHAHAAPFGGMPGKKESESAETTRRV